MIILVVINYSNQNHCNCLPDKNDKVRLPVEAAKWIRNQNLNICKK